MKNHETSEETVFADELNPTIVKVHEEAEGLLFGAESRFESPSIEKSQVNSYASYVCRAEDLGEPHSRYIGLAHDFAGILVIERSISEADMTLLAEAEDAKVEIISVQNNDPPIIVNFFSRAVEGAGVRVEGVETDASDSDLMNLAQTIQHPKLVEIAAPELTVRYANLFIALLQDHDRLRLAGWDKFMTRKIAELEAGLAEHVGPEAAHDEVELLRAKANSPVRGVLSGAVQPFSGKLARRILGL